MSPAQHISIHRACVAHLVWGPLGVGCLERFIQSYVSHDAAYDHRLVVILNDVDDRTAAAAAAVLADVAHHTLITPRSVMDLEAYRLVTRAFPADAYCFLNSYSRILCSSWLAHYVSALQLPGIGLVGAAGSYRSMRDFNPWRVREPSLPIAKRIALGLSTSRRAFRVRRQFPAGPSPYVRTNGFAIRADTIPLLSWPEMTTKWDTWRWEMGRQGLTARVCAAGLRCVVTDRDGEIFDVPAWPGSQTFWSGDQSGLMIADNRSDEYEHASPRERAELARANWCETRALVT